MPPTQRMSPNENRVDNYTGTPSPTGYPW